MLEVWGPVKFLGHCAGSDAYIVRSCEPLDVPIQSIQYQMLGCQLTHTLLNLIARTWPRSDQLGSCTPCVPHAQSLRRLV